jgi:signal transduction histidine kinase
MKRSRHRGGRWIEGGTLALALLSSLFLVLAATGDRADPGRAGRVALAEIASRVTRGVNASWERSLEGPGLASAASPVFRWSGEPAERPSSIEAGAGSAGALGFDMDLLLAARSELDEADLEGARGWIVTALSRPDIDLSRRGAAWLRGIQLALRAGDRERAFRYHEAARTALSGLEARKGTSLLLLISLAIAPALEEPERLVLRSELVDAWERDQIALPGRGAELRRRGREVVLREEPEVAALRSALEELAEGEIAAVSTARGVRALRRAVGLLPDPPAGERWSLESTPLGLFASRRGAEGIEAYFVDPLDVAAHLDERARDEGFLEDRLRIEVSGAGDAPVVAEWISLVGSVLLVDVTHADPTQLVATERSAAGRIRFALLATALVIAIAGAVTYRAIRRERLLQELRSSFVADVSHELRTPLASILLMAENLEAGRVDGDRAALYHRTIRSEALRLRRLVEDVLDFSRLERGERPKLGIEEVELSPWLDELESGWERAAERTGGSVLLSRASSPVAAAIDANALRRVLDNLVDNGLEHGGGEVRVSMRIEEGALFFEVRDHGPGIPVTSVERIFEAFVRLDPDPSTRAAGAGLGLAIAREIVEAHGGTIEALRPAEGRGALFRIVLPAEERDE